MRTRFLPTDYFNSATETLEFFHCPPPHLPPPSYSSIHEDLQRCFDDVSAFSVSLEIGKLPIEASLNKFLADVLPQFIDDEVGDFEDDLSAAGTACSCKRRSFCTHLTLEIDASEVNLKFIKHTQRFTFLLKFLILCLCDILITITSVKRNAEMLVQYNGKLLLLHQDFPVENLRQLDVSIFLSDFHLFFYPVFIFSFFLISVFRSFCFTSSVARL